MVRIPFSDSDKEVHVYWLLKSKFTLHIEYVIVNPYVSLEPDSFNVKLKCFIETW